MLTWMSVIGMSLLVIIVYLYTLLQNRGEEERLLQHRQSHIRDMNEKRAEEYAQLHEHIENQKTEMKQTLEQAKTYRKEAKQIARRIPELKEEFYRWEAFELTEEEALRQYKNWK